MTNGNRNQDAFFNCVKNSFQSDDQFTDAIIKTLLLRAKADARTDENVGGYVYLMQDKDLIKIGKTKNNPTSRCNALKVGNANIKLIAYLFSDNYNLLETQLHERYSSKKITGEWYKLSKKEIDSLIRSYSFIK